jgi:ribosomal protein L35
LQQDESLDQRWNLQGFGGLRRWEAGGSRREKNHKNQKKNRKQNRKQKQEAGIELGDGRIEAEEAED